MRQTKADGKMAAPSFPGRFAAHPKRCQLSQYFDIELLSKPYVSTSLAPAPKHSHSIQKTYAHDYYRRAGQRQRVLEGQFQLLPEDATIVLQRLQVQRGNVRWMCTFDIGWSARIRWFCDDSGKVNGRRKMRLCRACANLGECKK